MCMLVQEFAAKGSFIQYGGVVDHALVVRGITTVYNTDYMTDFVFHLNGALKVRVPSLLTSSASRAPRHQPPSVLDRTLKVSPSQR